MPSTVLLSTIDIIPPTLVELLLLLYLAESGILQRIYLFLFQQQLLHFQKSQEMQFFDYLLAVLSMMIYIHLLQHFHLPYSELIHQPYYHSGLYIPCYTLNISSST